MEKNVVLSPFKRLWVFLENDWGFKGPRAVKEFLGSVHESGVDLGAYHLQWAKNSNVNPHSSICHEHRNLLEVLRLGLLLDV